MTSFLTMAVPSPLAPAPAGAQEAVPQDDFVITGEIDGLYPGQRTTLDAQVTNLQAFSITVTSIEVTVDDAGPGCAASWLHFDPLTDPVDVAAGATGTVPVPVELDFDAPEACNGASWPLTLHATAVGAGDAVVPPGPGGGGQGPERAVPPSEAGGSIPEWLARAGVDVAPILAVGTLLVAAGLLARRTASRRMP